MPDPMPTERLAEIRERAESVKTWKAVWGPPIPQLCDVDVPDLLAEVERLHKAVRAWSNAHGDALDGWEEAKSERDAARAELAGRKAHSERLRAELKREKIHARHFQRSARSVRSARWRAVKRYRTAEAERDAARAELAETTHVLAVTGEKLEAIRGQRDRAEAERDAARARAEHLSKRAAELSEFEAGIKSLTAADGSIDMSLSLAHDLMRTYVASFVEILNAADAPNFVELMFKLAGTTDRYTVTIRRPDGETPGEVLGKLRAEHEQLTAQRNAVIDLAAREQNDAAADVHAGGPTAQLADLTVPVHDLLIALGVITPDQKETDRA